MTLDQALLDAHAAQDKDTLVLLYTSAADQSKTSDAACFYLTQAYIFALEQGHPSREALYLRLKSQDRV